MTIGEPPSSFLGQLHATFGVPAQAVTELIRRATGMSGFTVIRVVHGYDNEVYRAELHGLRVFARIRQLSDESFSTEAWAMDAARHAGVPVPEVLLLDDISTEEGPRAAMVLAAARGTAISDIADAPSSNRATALQRSGQVLAQLHTVATPGFWRPTPDGTWPLTDWQTSMSGFIRGRTAERDLIVSIGTDIEFDHMVELMAIYVRDYPCTQPVLCHGDFTPDHVFVDHDLRVSDVIDFGMFGAGPAAGDLAFLNFRLTPEDFNAVIAGYGNESPEFRRAIDLHTVGLAIGHLAHHVTIGDTDGTRSGLRRLTAAIQRL